MSVCVCVSERERERKSVCVCLRERERESVCVCVWERVCMCDTSLHLSQVYTARSRRGSAEGPMCASSNGSNAYNGSNDSQMAPMSTMVPTSSVASLLSAVAAASEHTRWEQPYTLNSRAQGCSRLWTGYELEGLATCCFRWCNPQLLFVQGGAHADPGGAEAPLGRLPRRAPAPGVFPMYVMYIYLHTYIM